MTLRCACACGPEPRVKSAARPPGGPGLHDLRCPLCANKVEVAVPAPGTPRQSSCVPVGLAIATRVSIARIAHVSRGALKVAILLLDAVLEHENHFLQAVYALSCSPT